MSIPTRSVVAPASATSSHTGRLGGGVQDGAPPGGGYWENPPGANPGCWGRAGKPCGMGWKPAGPGEKVGRNGDPAGWKTPGGTCGSGEGIARRGLLGAPQGLTGWPEPWRWGCGCPGGNGCVGSTTSIRVASQRPSSSPNHGVEGVLMCHHSVQHWLFHLAARGREGVAVLDGLGF